MKASHIKPSLDGAKKTKAGKSMVEGAGEEIVFLPPEPFPKNKTLTKPQQTLAAAPSPHVMMAHKMKTEKGRNFTLRCCNSTKGCFLTDTDCCAVNYDDFFLKLDAVETSQ